VTLRDKEYRSEIRKAQDVKPLLRIKRSHLLYVSSAICPECFGKEWRSKSFGLQSAPTGKRPKVCPRTRWRNYIFDLSWSHLDVEPEELYEITVSVLFFCDKTTVRTVNRSHSIAYCKG